MRKKNISMLLKLSLIVLFAGSTVPQSFAGDKDDSSRLWGWGRNIFNCVKLGSAAVTVASGGSALYYEKQKKDRASESKGVGRQCDECESVLASNFNFESLRRQIYMIDGDGDVVGWTDQDGQQREERLRSDMSSEEMTIDQRAHRHFIEKTFLNNRKLLEPWVSRLELAELGDKDSFEAKVKTFAFLAATKNKAFDSAEISQSCKNHISFVRLSRSGELLREVKELNQKIGRFGKIALTSATVFGLTAGLSGDRRTQIATSVVAPVVVLTAHFSPSMKAALAVFENPAKFEPNESLDEVVTHHILLPNGPPRHGSEWQSQASSAYPAGTSTWSGGGGGPVSEHVGSGRFQDSEDLRGGGRGRGKAAR